MPSNPERYKPRSAAKGRKIEVSKRGQYCLAALILKPYAWVLDTPYSASVWQQMCVETRGLINPHTDDIWHRTGWKVRVENMTLEEKKRYMVLMMYDPDGKLMTTPEQKLKILELIPFDRMEYLESILWNDAGIGLGGDHE